ncbi:MAG TPA: alpha/beta hydrolase [Opitutaceae bacterium]|jgi:acetyl esterase/lipase|nr:alpha/beta hydrolase [Opitutaceae bacterium]
MHPSAPLVLAGLLLTALTLRAEEPLVVPLWPGAAPGSEHVTIREKITERSADPQKPDRIYTQIVTPTLTIHRPAHPNGVGIIVAPGGGYLRIVIDKEGPDTSAWLNRIGVTALVLKYRLPDEGHEHPLDVALEDGQRAVRLARAHAREWGLDPNRIGFLGYSAGGHLASSVAYFSDAHVYAPVDAADALSARPDFAILGYAVGARGEPPASLDTLPPHVAVTWKYRFEPKPGVAYPPTFLFQANDDPTVPPATTAETYLKLKRSGTPAEMHMFLRGGHGFGIRDAKGPNAIWPRLCEAWMGEIGVLR